MFSLLWHAMLCYAMPHQTVIVFMQNGDVGATPEFDGDHVKAHASIKEKTFIMPAERDLYHPIADEEYAGCQMQSCVLFLEFGDILQVVGQTLKTLISLTMLSPSFWLPLAHQKLQTVCPL